MKSHTEISTPINGHLVVNNLKKLTESNGNIFQIKIKTIVLYQRDDSYSKSYCDGTHIKIEWRSEEKERYQLKKVENYTRKKITTHDNSGIYSHFGFCTGERN